MRRICIATGSRAEYGHMRWLAADLAAHPDVELMIVAASAHLSPAHGNTVAEIEADGHAVERVHSLMADDSPLAAAKGMGLALMGFAEVFERIRPDIVVILGDRYEMLAAASAAMLLRIPIAHLHGGEATEGCIDEAVRHSLTKMSHLHFVAAEPYRQRVIQLGENPARVFDFGAPGLDHLTRTPMMERAELEVSLGMALRDPILLVTYHPPSLEAGDKSVAARALVSALADFSDATIVFTGVNADPDNHAVSRVIRDFAETRSDHVKVFDSLGSRRYLGLMRLAGAVVGNSSSGIIEAPALKVPSVNIGDRQKGRLRSGSVRDCPADAGAISQAVAWALSPSGREAAASALSPYGSGDASRRIAEVLAGTELNGILDKAFHPSCKT